MRSAALVAGFLLAYPAAPLVGQGMPFYTPTALPLPLAESSIRSFYRHVELRSMLDQGREVANPDGIRVGVDVVPVVAPYGLTRRTLVVAGIPYMRKTFERSGTNQTNSGVGDAFILVKQELLAADFVAGNRRLAIFGGATLPTGETEDETGPLPAPLRLGAGVVNLTGQAVYSYVNNRIGAHGAVAYTAAAASDGGVRIGDRFGYDLALGLRLFPAVYRTLRDVTLGAYLEFNGTVEQPASTGGDPLADTGGHTLFVSPGLQLIPLPNWAIEASFQLPVVRELRGVQLAPDWAFAIGARAVFYLLGG
ncbi:MAG: hypothetical protein HYV20_13785 [Gemmatimonadetes bacterium]|nr:hypothetical protein [Gemmatimonadota bacterium]